MSVHEHSLNVELAKALRAKNPRWRDDARTISAERTRELGGGGRADILIFGDAVIAIETEYESRAGDNDAIGRLGDRVGRTGQLIEHAVALRVPDRVAGVADAELPAAVRGAQYQYCLYSRADGGAPPGRFPADGYIAAGLDALVAMIENAAVSERLIEQSLDTLEGGVSRASARLLDGTRDKPEVQQQIAALLHQEQGEQTCRMAMAIVANALTFHRAIAGHRGIKSLQTLEEENKWYLLGLLRHWRWIVENINYFPVFDIANKILAKIPEPTVNDIIRLLTQDTLALVKAGVVKQQDVYGRVFQKLISDRKFLATFYTRPESAMLLAELAVDLVDADFADAEAVKNLRVADFACGTGTLLSAAYRAILARVKRAGHDDADLHRHMVENALIATDIMPAGTHLAVSMLSTVHPSITFDETKISTLRFGDENLSLGALDLLEREAVRSLFYTRQQHAGRGARALGAGAKGQDSGAIDSNGSSFELEHESCDLVIMNPPFTRLVNKKSIGKAVPAFAGFGTSNARQKQMSAKLNRISRQLPMSAGHGNAGLATNFMDLAHLKLKPGGVLALVIPLTFVQGAAWEKARRLIGAHYDGLKILSIIPGGRETTSFSADTGMGEVLLIGKKRTKPRAQNGGGAPVRFISLHQRPKSPVHAAVVAELLGRAPDSLRLNGGVIGEVWDGTLENCNAVGVYDIGTVEVAANLMRGVLRLPPAPGEHAVPMTKLGELAEPGLNSVTMTDARVNASGIPAGPFEMENIRGEPTYPCLWAHNAERERRLIVIPDSQGRRRRNAPQAKVDRVWATASRLHFSINFRTTSNSILACVTPMPTLGGRAWPTAKLHDESHLPAIALWSNSLLGLLLWWHSSTRQHDGRASKSVSALADLPMLDTRCLSAAQHKKAARIFDAFSNREFRPANEAYQDPARQDLDRAVLVDLLGLPQSAFRALAVLRKKWCAEPSVHGEKSTQIRHAWGAGD